MAERMGWLVGARGAQSDTGLDSRAIGSARLPVYFYFCSYSTAVAKYFCSYSTAGPSH